MITCSLPGYKRAIMNLRDGVPAITRKLLRRAEGLDLLDPGEDIHVTVTKETVVLSGEEVDFEFRDIDELLYPNPGYSMYGQSYREAP